MADSVAGDPRLRLANVRHTFGEFGWVATLWRTPLAAATLATIDRQRNFLLACMQRRECQHRGVHHLHGPGPCHHARDLQRPEGANQGGWVQQLLPSHAGASHAHARHPPARAQAALHLPPRLPRPLRTTSTLITRRVLRVRAVLQPHCACAGAAAGSPGGHGGRICHQLRQASPTPTAPCRRHFLPLHPPPETHTRAAAHPAQLPGPVSRPACRPGCCAAQAWQPSAASCCPSATLATT
jgi:hypothetical protein